jgi:hypothetical protein
MLGGHRLQGDLYEIILLCVRACMHVWARARARVHMRLRACHIIARQQLSNHTPPATNMHAMIEELLNPVFSVVHVLSNIHYEVKGK